MGALHKGHISLLADAKTKTDVVVCSIFVNPTQFNDPKDFEKYPRPIERDIQMLEQAHCDVLFNPPVEEIYAPDEAPWHLDIGPLESLLEGEFRPGHYQGVTQVVFKLFDIVKPDMAFFGQKDYQQVLIITRMVQLLHLPVKIVTCPIIRENDGLAMSSRNAYLSAAERAEAPRLHRVLQAVKGGMHPDEAFAQLSAAGWKPDYVEVRRRDDLGVPDSRDKERVVLAAARLGATRLIDNLEY